MEYSLLDLKYAYAGGIIDGEGCVNLTKNGLTLVVGVCSQELTSFLKQNFCGGVNISKCNSSGRLFYRWVLNSTPASNLLKRVLPYLIIKKNHALLAISFQSKIDTHKDYAYGKVLTKSELKERESMVEQMHKLNHGGK